MPTPHSVFSIKNLQCAYEKGRPVLRIDALDIPAGSLVFLIGPSGVGKSTFIETLGLMNRTVMQGTDASIQFSPSGEADSTELASAWSLPADELASIRRRHFSFIFQSTNLMPNFSSGENMAMSLLIKGSTRAEAEREVRRVMEKVGLDDDVFDKAITAVSGGQRQRLAFVRAITADFDVLFGDEPTGNLDAGTANSLMETVREKIGEGKGQKTGIVVSHDLPLAARFADVIIPIASMKHENGEVYGQIRPADVLRSSRAEKNAAPKWFDAAGKPVDDPMSHLGKFVFQSIATTHTA